MRPLGKLGESKHSWFFQEIFLTLPSIQPEEHVSLEPQLAEVADIHFFEKVSCVSPRCKFSPTHPIDCLPPYCSRTCWQ